MKNFVLLFYIQIAIAFPAGAQNFELNLLDKINNSGTRGDLFNKRQSQSAGPVTAAVPATLFVIGLLAGDDELKAHAYRSAIAAASTGAAVLSIKFLADRDRPYEAYPDMFVRKADIFTPSFPSGHTAFAFSTSVSVTMAFPKWYAAAPAFTWAVGVGYSRMHLGVHYPSDVLAGAVIGTVASWLAWTLTKGLMR